MQDQPPPSTILAIAIAHLRDKVATFRQFTDIAGLPEIQQLEKRYGVPDDERAGL